MGAPRAGLIQMASTLPEPLLSFVTRTRPVQTRSAGGRLARTRRQARSVSLRELLEKRSGFQGSLVSKFPTCAGTT
jgi:hypothetical protein